MCVCVYRDSTYPFYYVMMLNLNVWRNSPEVTQVRTTFDTIPSTVSPFFLTLMYRSDSEMYKVDTIIAIITIIT